MTPQPELQVPPKQLVYNGAIIDVVPQPGGCLLRVAVPACGELHVFPISTELAQDLGRKLTAPRLHAVGANGNGGAA